MYVSWQFKSEMSGEWMWIWQSFRMLAVVCSAAVWKWNGWWANVNMTMFYYAGCCANRNCLEIKCPVSEWQLFIMLVVVRIAAVQKRIVHWINVNLAKFNNFFCCMYHDSLEIKCPVSECESGNNLWQWLLYISQQLVNEMSSEWMWICQRFIILAVVCIVAVWKLNTQWVVLKVFSFILNKWM